MDVDAFLTKLTFGEVGTIFLWMEESAFFVRVVAVREMPASYLLFVTFMNLFYWLWFSTPDVIFMLREIND